MARWQIPNTHSLMNFPLLFGFLEHYLFHHMGRITPTDGLINTDHIFQRGRQKTTSTNSEIDVSLPAWVVSDWHLLEFQKHRFTHPPGSGRHTWAMGRCSFIQKYPETIDEHGDSRVATSNSGEVTKPGMFIMYIHVWYVYIPAFTPTMTLFCGKRT